MPGETVRLAARGACCCLLAALLAVGVLAIVAAGCYGYRTARMAEPAQQQGTPPDDRQNVPRRACPGAPWLLPTGGVLGVLWNDTRVPPYGPDHPHTGLDIFGEGREKTVPVYAVADGLLTRLPDWESAVTIQHDDPFRPGEKVWSYYSHMASASGRESYVVENFPPGSANVPVKAGQLLGYQGVWSGHPLKPNRMHLHFSVVQAAGNGWFLNETALDNTFDPSPYLGIVGNAGAGHPNWQPLRCQEGIP